jgi:hypothetical protein
MRREKEIVQLAQETIENPSLGTWLVLGDVLQEEQNLFCNKFGKNIIEKIFENKDDFICASNHVIEKPLWEENRAENRRYKLRFFKEVSTDRQLKFWKNIITPFKEFIVYFETDYKLFKNLINKNTELHKLLFFWIESLQIRHITAIWDNPPFKAEKVLDLFPNIKNIDTCCQSIVDQFYKYKNINIFSGNFQYTCYYSDMYHPYKNFSSCEVVKNCPLTKT